MADVADALHVDGVVLDDVVDARDDILAVLLAPFAPRGPLERVAIASGATEVGVEDEITVGGEVLILEIERIARR